MGHLLSVFREKKERLVIDQQQINSLLLTRDLPGSVSIYGYIRRVRVLGHFSQMLQVLYSYSQPHPDGPHSPLCVHMPLTRNPLSLPCISHLISLISGCILACPFSTYKTRQKVNPPAAIHPIQSNTLGRGGANLAVAAAPMPVVGKAGPPLNATLINAKKKKFWAPLRWGQEAALEGWPLVRFPCKKSLLLG